VKVFVTGGTGFIGGAISRALIARGDEVLLLARSETKAKSLHPQCQVVKGDLTSIGDVAKKHLRGVDAVVHCAAHVAPFGNWADFYKLNVAATEHLADAALSWLEHRNGI
jgi:nucleoside-diphosphate-sugar epimerase